MITKGFSLIEVLIAAFVLTFGILTLAGMQIIALQQVQDATYRSVAINQLTNILQQYAVGDFDCSVWRSATLKLLPHATAKCNQASVSICWLNKQNKNECLRQPITRYLLKFENTNL